MTTVDAIREAIGLAPLPHELGERTVAWAWVGRLPGWRTEPDGSRTPAPTTRASWSQREALEDLIALWVFGLQPSTRELAARWSWTTDDVAALKRTAEGMFPTGAL